MKKIKTIFPSLIVYFIIVSAFVYAFFGVEKTFEPRIVSQVYDQPSQLEQWSIKSIDTQIISKHWLDVPRESIVRQVKMLKDLNVNYIAVATPYDRRSELKMWVDEIHKQGLHVWFRSHWASWEGDDNKPANMIPQAYLDQTYLFIKSNPDLFKPGDAFTVAVEAEQVGVGLGKRFLTWDEYRAFLLNQIDYSNRAFEEIGLERRVYTNWLSTNLWVAENVYNEDIVSKIGMITVDHYAAQSETIGTLDDPDAYSKQMSKDLDSLHRKWNKPILIGEWGYQIHQDVSEQHQLEVVKEVISEMKSKPYIVGFNYWAHMGNSARIIDDTYGSNLEYRLAAEAIKDLFK